MSHITDVKCSILDLDALAAAAKSLGLEMVKQGTYKWYGTKVGSEPLPTGFTKADLGKCEYAIRLPDGHGDKTAGTYEVGVMERRDGQPGYTLMFDSWLGGMGLMKQVAATGPGLKEGDNAGLLLQAYTREVTKKQLVKQGYRVNESKTAAGEIRLVATKR